MHSGRICDISRLTTEAKEIFRELEHKEFLKKIEETVQAARVDPLAPYNAVKCHPRYVVWELTLACNMKCDHCGSAAGKARHDELTLDQMYRVCDELGELECERLTLLGGEPLIHPHWFEVAQRINQNGFRANVITNGWTLHKEAVCDKIKEANLSIVGISIDGIGEAHDSLRKRPGSFDRIIKGIDLLRQREVSIAASTVITNDSLDCIEEMYQLFLEKDVRVWQLQVGNPLGRMERDDPRLIKPERLKEVFSFLTEKGKANTKLRIDAADNLGYFGSYEHQGVRHSRKKTYFWKGCFAGIQAMGLDSNGDVKGCQSMPSTPRFIEGNVRQRSLKDIWNDPQAFSYNRQYKIENLQGFCGECHYGALCKAGCTSAALSMTGDIYDNPMCIYRVEQAEARAGK